MKAAPVKRVRLGCPHGTRRGRCKIGGCFGANLCKHKITRYNCRDVECRGGSGFCRHGKMRTLCAAASCNGGGSLCAHGVNRSYCASDECGGKKYLCAHKKRKHLCSALECHGGGALCKAHKIPRERCKECLSMQQRLESKRFCKLCSDTFLSWPRRRAGILFCAKCDPSVPQRVELVIRPLLVERIGRAATIADDFYLGGAGCDATKRRPDLFFLSASEYPKMISKQLGLVGGCAVCIETDEDSHRDRLSACEAAKLCDEMTAIQKLCGDQTRCIFLRFKFKHFGNCC